MPQTDGVRATRYARPAAPGRLYDDLIVEHSKLHNVRPDLVRAVVQVESAFNPVRGVAEGRAGADAADACHRAGAGRQQPVQPCSITFEAACAYLRQLLDRYDNDEVLALAAYNAGPEAVAKYGQKVPPYRETRNYVTKINEIAGAPPRSRPPQIYRSADVTVDGRVIPKYTDKKPQ